MTAPAPTTSTPAAHVVLTQHPDSIKVGKRFRKDLGNIDALVESIREVGLLHRVVVDAHSNLIAGERRLAACRLLGWRQIPTTIVDLDAEKTLRAQDDENAIRKDFTPTEAVAIRDARIEREKEKARERTVNAHSQPGKVSQADKGRAKDKAAAGTGYSSKTLDKAAAVVEAAAADRDLEHVVEEMDRTGKVDPAYRKVAPSKVHAHTASGPVDDPNGLTESGRMSKAPQDVFARMLNIMSATLDATLPRIDTSVIIPTTTQKKQLAHILHALGKVRRTVEQNAVTAKAFGTGPDDRKVVNDPPTPTPTAM